MLMFGHRFLRMIGADHTDAQQRNTYAIESLQCFIRSRRRALTGLAVGRAKVCPPVRTLSSKILDSLRFLEKG